MIKQVVRISELMDRTALRILIIIDTLTILSIKLGQLYVF